MIPERFGELASRPDLHPVADQLLREGYAIVRCAAPVEFMLAMSDDLDSRFEATPFCVGPFHGARTKRFHRLLARAPGSADLVLSRAVLEPVLQILGSWCDFPELNLTQGVEIHPGAPAQIPHCDQAMWARIPKGEMELCVNVFWPMTPFTRQNGGTRVWPRSHFKLRDPSEPLPEPVVAELQPGDALMILGSTVHGAGGNFSAERRRAAIVSYCLGWLKAYENQSLAYPPALARGFPEELAALAGYRWHRPNLGTSDGQCPSILLRDDTPDHLATVDALSHEHEVLVARHAATQDAGVAA